jgi:hypothetical protein
LTDVRSNRLAAGAGILAAVLFVAGFVLVGVDAPTSDATRSEVVATYADDSTNSRQALGVLLTGLGGICFLPFLAYIRGVLGQRSRASSVLPTAALAGGIALVGGLVTGAVLSSAVSAGAYFDAHQVDADLAMTLVAAGFYLDGFAAMAGGVLIVAVAVVARHAALLPRWLTVLGFVVAAASIPAGLLGMWILVEALWIAIAAGLIARRSGAERPAGVVQHAARA